MSSSSMGAGVATAGSRRPPGIVRVCVGFECDGVNEGEGADPAPSQEPEFKLVAARSRLEDDPEGGADQDEPRPES